jgi:hypothetical protein
MIYVYKLPAKLSDGYCFGVGNLIGFTNVDWFDGDGYPAGRPPTRAELTEFVKHKRYYQTDRRFLVLGDTPEHVFTIDPERARCPTCGADVASIFDHVDGCPEDDAK